jgi:hypothetical protein
LFIGGRVRKDSASLYFYIALAAQADREKTAAESVSSDRFDNWLL